MKTEPRTPLGPNREETACPELVGDSLVEKKESAGEETSTAAPPKPAPRKKGLTVSKGIFLAAVSLAIISAIGNQLVGWEWEPMSVARIKACSRNELDQIVWLTNVRLARDSIFGDDHDRYINFVNMGNCSLRLGDTEQAERWLLKAADLEGTGKGIDTGTATYALMEFYFAKGDHTRAGAYATKWLPAQRWELNPAKIGQYLFCAHVCSRASLTDQARIASDLARRSGLQDSVAIHGEPPGPDSFDEPLDTLYRTACNAMALDRYDDAVSYLRFLNERRMSHREPKSQLEFLRVRSLMMLAVAEMGQENYQAAASDFPKAIAAYQALYAHWSDVPAHLRNQSLARERRALYASYAKLLRRQGKTAAANKWTAAAEAGFEEELHPERWHPWWQ